jgi:DNA-binding SARP family transcriptional activator
MQASTLRFRAGGAVQLIAALAALGTPPMLLAAAIGNPLPTWPIDWTGVVAAVQAGLIPSSFWVNVLALAAWSTWAVLVGMLAVEVVAVARNRPSSAGVPVWIRHLAQALVAAAISLAGPGQPALALAAAGVPTAVAAAPATDTEEAPSRESGPIAESRTVTVADGDSWGGFAADVLGDASLGPELRSANLGREVGDGQRISESTAFVEPGWRLLIPNRLDSGTPLPTVGRVEVDAVSDHAEHEVWQVERGDHLWRIAKTTLADAWGRTPTDAEIVPYWQQLIEDNRDELAPPGDPNLIHPGQEFVLPMPPPSPGAASAESAPARPSSSEPEQSEPQPAPAGTEEPREQAAVHGERAPAPVAPEHSVGRDGWQATMEREPAPSVLDEAPSGDLDEDPRTALGVPAGLPVGLAAASILAAGVIATLRWRRRALLQQRAPGMRLPTPLPETDAEVAKLDAAAVPEETLDDLAALLASIPLDVHPVLVRATDDGQVTLLFDDHADLPDPPPPWTLADDGTDGPVGWKAQIGDRGPERSFGLPLLMTLGRSGTSTVLANVGALGTLGLEGPPLEVRRRLRAMSLDLATSRVSFPVEVAIAGDERLGSLDRVRKIDDPGGEVELALAEIEDVVIDDRVPRLLICHQGTAPPEVPEELVGTVGVVAADAAASATWVLDIEDAHTGRLHLPDGGSVRLALPDIDAELVDDELNRLNEPASLEPMKRTAESARPVVDPSSNGHASQGPATRTELAWCEVRLLGPVEVVRDGTRVEGLTPGTLEILVYLATHRHGVTKERLDHVIWAGAAARPGSQRVTSALTKLRKVLGDGPDGEPLVPRRSGDEPIVMSKHLGTDLDRALAHLAVAHDLPADLRARDLAAALELVRGEPLEGHPYSWATDICEQAIVELQDAALELARASREAGDLDAAERAVGQGLQLLDPNGWLYLERAHLACLRGRVEQPPRIFEQYRRKLADDADEIAGTVASPPPEIELAFRELMVSA